MKKTIIAIVVVLAAALVGLKYLASKKQASSPVPAGTAQQTEQTGVALPDSAKDYSAANTESVYVPTQANGSYEAFSLPPAAMAMKGACEGGSIKDIVENHGKTWGYFTGQRIAFDNKKTMEMYNFVGDYYACLAAARQDFTVCNELPAEAEKDGIKIDADKSPMNYCRSKASLLLFKAYVAGKAKDQQNCMGYFSDWDSANLARISPPDFCTAAAKGSEPLLAYVKEKMPNIYPMAEKTMAFSREVCKDDPVCLANNGTWEGVRTGNASKCAPGLAPHCAALAQKSQTPCSTILMDMSTKYCGYYKDLLKAGGGYAGVTADEVKETLRQQAQKKADEDKARKAQEAVMKETNEKVRKMINKKGGE